MENKQRIEMEREQQRREQSKKIEQEPPYYISPMQPLTESAYGGGMYGTEEGDQESLQIKKVPASQTQSADGPVEAEMKLKHPPPPSSGDRDIDITGQSYFQ
ncbi:uncharacterized protein LOC103493802 [Cucumis melo]|uniref:Uncharacterized protein LOC103493802 n=1 Tax=Cucumis melo TaxID=3656 RepID=A0A1S3BV26_CUCME|nr:uncharacterized protein LOC103493802 [Cucumis melo]